MKKRTFVCIESSRTSLAIPETQKKQAPPVPKVFDSNIHSSSQTHIPKKLKPHTKNNNFAGIFPSNVLPQIRNKSDVEKIKHFQILPVSQFIWVLLGSFSSSWLSHIWYILLAVVLQGTVLKKVLQSSGIIQPRGSQLRSFDSPYRSTFITRSNHGKGVKPWERGQTMGRHLLSGKKTKPPKQLLEKGWHFQTLMKGTADRSDPLEVVKKKETGWVFGYHFLRVFR